MRNEGDADAAWPANLGVTSGEAVIIAGDAVGGYQRLDVRPTGCTLRPTTALQLQRLAPGEGRVICWLRLSADKEVRVHVTPADDGNRRPVHP